MFVTLVVTQHEGKVTASQVISGEGAAKAEKQAAVWKPDGQFEAGSMLQQVLHESRCGLLLRTCWKVPSKCPY